MNINTDCGRYNPETYHLIDNDISRPLAMYSEGARLFMYFCTSPSIDAKLSEHRDGDVVFFRSMCKWNRTSIGFVNPEKMTSWRKSARVQSSIFKS